MTKYNQHYGCLLDQTWLIKKIFNFEQDELGEYGIDWDGPLPQEAEPSSTAADLTDVLCPLNPQEEEEIRRQINQLQESNCYGIDIFMQARLFVSDIKLLPS